MSKGNGNGDVNAVEIGAPAKLTALQFVHRLNQTMMRWSLPEFAAATEQSLDDEATREEYVRLCKAAEILGRVSKRTLETLTRE